MPPAKLSCVTCRVSKAKCDLHIALSGRCTRCSSLGQQCIPADPPAALAKRPRVGAVKDAALTQAPGLTPPTSIQPPSVIISAAHLAKDVLCGKRPDEIPIARLTCHLRTTACKVSWLQQTQFVSHRQKCLAGLAQVMQYAVDLGVPFDELMTLLAPIDYNKPPREVKLSSFIAEWLTPGALTIVRVQSDGGVSYLASPDFARVAGLVREGHAGLNVPVGLGVLLNGQPGGFNDLFELTGRLWSQVEQLQPRAGESSAQCVAVELNHATPLRLGGVARGAFRMRGRLLVADGNRQSCTAVNFVPAHEPLTRLAPRLRTVLPIQPRPQRPSTLSGSAPVVGLTQARLEALAAEAAGGLFMGGLLQSSPSLPLQPVGGPASVRPTPAAGGQPLLVNAAVASAAMPPAMDADPLNTGTQSTPLGGRECAHKDAYRAAGAQPSLDFEALLGLFSAHAPSELLVDIEELLGD